MIIVNLIPVLIAFLLGVLADTFVSKSTYTDKIKFLVEYAERYVVFIENTRKDLDGESKFVVVKELLEQITKTYKIKICDDEIMAIIEKAYNDMVKKNK